MSSFNNTIINMVRISTDVILIMIVHMPKPSPPFIYLPTFSVVATRTCGRGVIQCDRVRLDLKTIKRCRNSSLNHQLKKHSTFSMYVRFCVSMVIVKTSNYIHLLQYSATDRILLYSSL